jgi:hypothetical protein
VFSDVTCWQHRRIHTTGADKRRNERNREETREVELTEMVYELIKALLELLRAKEILTAEEFTEIENAIKTDRYNRTTGDNLLGTLREIVEKVKK